MSPTTRAGLLAGGIVLAAAGVLAVAALLAGGPAPPAAAAATAAELSSADRLALNDLAQAKWEKEKSPQSNKRWLTVSQLGLHVGDRRVSEGVRSQLVAFLKTLRDDPLAGVRQEAEKALHDAPKPGGHQKD